MEIMTEQQLKKRSTKGLLTHLKYLRSRIIGITNTIYCPCCKEIYIDEEYEKQCRKQRDDITKEFNRVKQELSNREHIDPPSFKNVRGARHCPYPVKVIAKIKRNK